MAAARTREINGLNICVSLWTARDLILIALRPMIFLCFPSFRSQLLTNILLILQNMRIIFTTKRRWARTTRLSRLKRQIHDFGLLVAIFILLFRLPLRALKLLIMF